MAELIAAEMQGDVKIGQPALPTAGADLSRLKRMFSEARSTTAGARRQAQSDRDYYDNIQWTSDELKVLKDRGQPSPIFNRIGPTIDGILGVLEKGQADPRALPRGKKDQAASEVATDVLRFVADQTRWNRTKLDCAEDAAIEGIGAAIFEVDDNGDTTAEQIAYDDFFYDPRSRRSDFKDARFLGIAKWMYVDEVAARWSERGVPTDRESLRALQTGGIAGDVGLSDDTSEDKPNDAWSDPVNRRVRVVEVYYQEAGWKRCVFWAGGELESGDSPYLDERDRPMCPIEAVSAYVRKRDNARYGAVRRMIGPQDEINARRSKLLHEVNSRQLEQTEIAPEVSAETAAAQAAKPGGVIPYGYRLAQRSDLAAGQANLLQESKAEIERMGPSPEVLGRQSASSSGRAQLVRQQAGLTELTPYLGNIDDFEYRAYRQMWARTRQFKTAPWYVRITDDDGAPEFLAVNEQVPVIGADGQPMMQIVQGPDGQPVLQPMMETKNQLAAMDIDIIIDSTPDTASLQQEQFTEMVDLARVGGLGQNPGPLLLEASNLPKKRELIEKLEAQSQQPPPAPDPEKEAKAKLLDSQAELNNAREYQIVRSTGQQAPPQIPEGMGSPQGPQPPPGMF